MDAVTKDTQTTSKTHSETSADAPQLPFAHLNMRRNPFGEVPVEERPALAVVEVDAYVAQVRDGTVIEFVGDSGRGKSTHLRAMADRIEEALYVHVCEEDPPAELPDRPVLCVDEAQFLPLRLRRSLFRSDADLALGTHVSLVDEVEAAGRTVESVSLGGRSVDIDVVRQIVNRRLEWARRTDGDLPRLSDETLAWLLDRYDDNLRAMEHHLYAVFQDLETVRPIGPEDLEAAPSPPNAIVETRPPRPRGGIVATLRRLLQRMRRSVREAL